VVDKALMTHPLIKETTHEMPRSRLRNYLLAHLIPLIGIPLFILAFLFYVLVGKVFDDELSRRAAPEMSAFARNLDTIEKKLSRELLNFARDEKLILGVMSRDSSLLENAVSTWFGSAHFESVRIFDEKGQLIAKSKNQHKSRVEKSWSIFLGTRPSSRETDKPQAKGVDRDPASNEKRSEDFKDLNELFDSKDKASLALLFRSFLSREEAWMFKRVSVSTDLPDVGKKMWEWVFYKRVVDSAYNTAAFVEAKIVMDSHKFEMISGYQGTDLVLLDMNLKPMITSSLDVESAFKKSESVLLNKKIRGLDGLALPLDVGGHPVMFYFTSPSDQFFGEPIWFGLGLYSGDRTAILNRIYRWVLTFALILALVVIVFIIRISGRITKPVSDLVQATEEIRMGTWRHPVAVDEKTEIGFLVTRFNEMAKSIQSSKTILESKLEELARAHGELSKTQDQLVQSAKLSSLGQLVAGVAHELNNPIAFIYSNMTQMKLHLNQIDQLNSTLNVLKKKLNDKERTQLEKKLEELEWSYVVSDMRDMVQSCLEGSIRVKDIVLGLRNFSRVDKAEVVSLEVNEVIRGTAKLLSGQIRNKVQLHWDLCENSQIEGNPSQIHQIFMNLLSNAVQAVAEKGDVWIKTELMQAKNFREEAKELLISVKDNGKGISGEHLDRIFDPFFTTKKVGEGTGLGLSIVYGIVERHGGRIEVSSRQEPDEFHGTEFMIFLPQRRSFGNSDDTFLQQDSNELAS